MPQINPCGALNIPPIGPANPWTAPKPAFAKAKPPNKLAKAISSRAVASLPFCTTADNECNPRQKKRAAQAYLNLVLEGRYHSVLGHLCSSTRGGGNRHARQSR